MAKSRKIKALGKLGAKVPLPSPEEVEKRILKTNVTPPKIESNQKPGQEKSKGGRKPLEVKRVALTTSLTESNKTKLRILAAQRGKRLSDVLNDILENYFKNIE